MSYSRFDTFVGTAILAAICVLGGVISSLVPSPYVETASGIDPIMLRVPATHATQRDSDSESTWTLTRAKHDMRQAQKTRYVN